MTAPPLTLMALLRWDRVRHLLPADAGSVVEVGCGQGAVGYRLAARANSYLGLEPDEQSHAVAAARLARLGRGAVRRGGIEALGATETFDLLCAFEVIEHIEDDRGALAAWLRHVRPRGHVLLSTPAYQSRFGVSDETVGHFRRYEPEQLAELLTTSGLCDVEVCLYGMPLGYALEAVRNRVLARRAVATGATMAERSGGSGRLFQPERPLTATAMVAAVAPFRLVQRAFPRRGVGLVARARVP